MIEPCPTCDAMCLRHGMKSIRQLAAEAQARDDIVRAAEDLTDSGWHGAERLAAAVLRWRGLDAARGT